jgi:hypothetical protein
MKPLIAPAAAAALTAQIPSRLVKKLDADPTMADRWTWTQEGAVWLVTTDKAEVVRLDAVDGVVREAAAVKCTCLLQPKCLHVAAVIAGLAPAEDVAAPAPVATAGSAPAVVAEVSTTATGAAEHAFRVVADVLATGAQASGAFAQGELLRAIHGCRTHGLHRLATSQTRILRSIRELRADVAGFSLGVLAADLREALSVAWAIGHAGDHAPALYGTARRDYEPAGNLRLRGVFTEAVIARSGYAGAVTYLIDDKGTFYTRADVAAGDGGRAAGAYDAPAGIGDAVLPHRELCRSGLFVSDATASADGRLGAGQKVRAVRASEPSRWDHPLLEARWKTPLPQQLAQLASHDASPDEVRPAGWDLVFVEGAIVGIAAGGVAFHAGDTLLALATAYDSRALPARDNLVVLGKAVGLRVRIIGRARLGAPRRLELLAIGPAADETRFAMPDAWHGRANLHYDRISLAPLGDTAIALAPAEPPDDLLAPMRRRVERVVYGGLGTLPMHAMPEIDREAAGLGDRALRGGGELLREMAVVAHDAGRAMTGERRAVDRRAFARAWLRAALYEDAARRRLSVASW